MIVSLHKNRRCKESTEKNDVHSIKSLTKVWSLRIELRLAIEDDSEQIKIQRSQRVDVPGTTRTDARILWNYSKAKTLAGTH